MKIEIDAIIFDLDGVLIDSGEDIANAVIHAISDLNTKRHTKQEIISFIGSGVEQLIRKAFDGCDDDTIFKAIKIYREYYIENCTVNTHLYSNVKDTLKYFETKKIAVLTNKLEDQSIKILEKLDIKKYMNLVYGPDSVPNMKPSPDGIFKILKEFDVKPNRAIMIGDSDTDIIAGKRAGVNTCGVTFGLGSLLDLKNEKPEFLIDNMIELKENII